jgi:hypothetical protein
MDHVLNIWVIYDHPKDQPDVAYLARRWEVDRIGERATKDALCAVALEPLRWHFGQLGLTCIGRNPADDPVIVECWL